MQKSIISILYSKFLRYLEETPSSDIFISFAKLFCWGITSISLVNIPEARENFAMAIKWHDFAIIKIFTSFLLVFYIQEIGNLLKSLFFWVVWSFEEFLPKKEEGKKYQGIPLIELVDYLFSAKSYSRNEFCEHFAVSRKVFDDMAEWFDKIGVFVRWKNNARELSEEYSRSDIASILTRATETGNLRPLMREVKWWYTHSPSHGFTTRSLHSSNWLPV